jgi:hypothetical protein
MQDLSGRSCRRANQSSVNKFISRGIKMFRKNSSFRSAFDSSRLRVAASRLVYIVAIAGTSLTVYSVATGIFGKEAVQTVNAQSDMYLTHRIDQIEQRFNYIESRLGQMESQQRSTSIVPRSMPGSNDQEIQFLRTQLDGMRIRLGEVECGLLHVDERTLTPAQRLARRHAAQGSSEKCRENSATPIELSARP